MTAAIKPKRGSKLVFKRFNGVKAEGTHKSTDNTGKRGPWLFVKVDWRDTPMKVRPGQLLSIDGRPVV